MQGPRLIRGVPAIWRQTSGTALLAVERCSLVRVWMAAQDSRSAHGLLYFAAVRDDRHHLTRKMEISWACGSGPWPSGPVRACEGGMGQAAWAGSVPSGAGSGMRQRVTSKPRDPSLPTWWAIWRRVSRWRS